MRDKLHESVVEYIRKAGISSSKELYENLGLAISYATFKRQLQEMITNYFLESTGKGRATKYGVSSLYEVMVDIDMNSYFEKEIDERSIKDSFNFKVIDTIFSKHKIFSNEETYDLELLDQRFKRNIDRLSKLEFQKEFERLAIDLSWKSSQIEGNKYSLLETERLLKDKETASGKTKEEAVMLLNHKEAIDFILDNPDYLAQLNVSRIEDIHSILISDLQIDRNLRSKRVGISGTNYRPLDNEFQIKEALKLSCDMINKKENVFEKAFLALILLSYIQPFMDGNKRTARIVSNAILMNERCCPLSFRTVDSLDYKKAMLLFYEQNNISNFKKIFINQYEFAVNTYF